MNYAPTVRELVVTMHDDACQCVTVHMNALGIGQAWFWYIFLPLQSSLWSSVSRLPYCPNSGLLVNHFLNQAFTCATLWGGVAFSCSSLSSRLFCSSSSMAKAPIHVVIENSSQAMSEWVRNSAGASHFMSQNCPDLPWQNRGQKRLNSVLLWYSYTLINGKMSVGSPVL